MGTVGESIESSGLDVFARSALHAVTKSIGTNSYKIISPLEIDADQNNYVPNGFDDASTIRLSAALPVNISGLKAGKDGDLKRLVNVGAQVITLLHASALSSESNRFLCVGSVDATLDVGGMVVIFYDGVTKRWRA